MALGGSCGDSALSPERGLLHLYRLSFRRLFDTKLLVPSGGAAAKGPPRGPRPAWSPDSAGREARSRKPGRRRDFVTDAGAGPGPGACDKRPTWSEVWRDLSGQRIPAQTEGRVRMHQTEGARAPGRGPGVGNGVCKGPGAGGSSCCLPGRSPWPPGPSAGGFSDPDPKETQMHCSCLQGPAGSPGAMWGPFPAPSGLGIPPAFLEPRWPRGWAGWLPEA